MDILEMIQEKKQKSNEPLAQRRKPVTLSDFVGQDHILGEGRLLRRLIESDRITSILLYGPPGTGKTSLARVISSMTKSDFVTINAVLSGVKDIRNVIDRAKMSLETQGVKTILFIDEIHRFNKAQQDALLYHVENGIITLIGATTENPYFEVNSALISRSNVFELKPLDKEDIVLILKKALEEDLQLLEKNVVISEDVLEYLAYKSDGDARRALNVLEIAVLSEKTKDNKTVITPETINESMQTKQFRYDKNADYHYDVISAFIKSVRGSDPQAALYYLAQMLLSGEDPKFIARRLLILSSEDIGLANPMALVKANAAFDAVHKLGMPEARIILSQITIYLCLSDKSNSAYLAIDNALDYVKNSPQRKVQPYLEDATKKKLSGNEETYLYPHSYPKHYVKQRYLPAGVEEKFYNPQDSEEETLLNELDERRKK